MVMVFGQMNEPPVARFRVGHAALTMAEYFRDDEHRDLWRRPHAGDARRGLHPPLEDKLLEHRRYINKYGQDLPEIRNCEVGPSHMSARELIDTATALALGSKGLFAMDDSNPSEVLFTGPQAAESRGARHFTSMTPIMPPSACSRMWQ
jgi:hypothetical protein